MFDLSDLFAQDPLTYTKEKGELGKIIAEFRSNRKKFLAGNITAGKTKPVTAKQKAIDEIAEKLGGSSLKLEL